MALTDFKNKYHLLLNKQQEMAVETVTGPVLLLAVPGSGKTTTLISRIGYMIEECNIQPDEILTMTYTVAAARDMKQRFVAVFGDTHAQNLEFRTINGVCSKIIRQYEYMYGRTAFDVVSQDQQAAIAGAAYRKICKDFANEGTIQAILLKVAFIKNSMLSKEERRKICVEGIRHFDLVYEEYNRILVENKLMDYDDQLRYAYSILCRFRPVLSKVQQRFKYVCVDEAQDTSKIQHEIIRLLISHTQNLFMVGDEDQSIYGFRAAYPQALMDFDKIYPNAKILLLEQNFRSTPQITSVADQFIRQNRERHPKTIQPVRGSGLPINYLYATSRKDQFDQLVTFARFCKTETAILYRNNDSAIPLIDQLDREGIPFRCRGLDSLFFVNRVVKDICDMLRFSLNPYDSEVFKRIYYKLNCGISKEMAATAIEISANSKQPILKCLCDFVVKSKYTRSMCKYRIQDFKMISRMRADTAISHIWTEWYKTYHKEHPGSSEKIETLKLLGLFQKTPNDFLNRMDELKEIICQGTMSQDCPLILSTIHSSKGLEYDRVILIDVIDGIFPQKPNSPNVTMSKEDLSELEEDRRLFYVGLTRAKNELMIVRFTPKDLLDDLTSCFTSYVLAIQKRQGKKQN